MKKKRTRKPMTPEQKQARERTSFKRRIRDVFVGMGFKYIPTGGKEVHIGRRTEEVDSLYVYENIWLLCEDTIKQSGIKDHIRTKNEAFGEIKGNLNSYRETISQLLPDYRDELYKYEIDRIQVYGLYIPKYDLSLTNDDEQINSNIKFVLPRTLNYFSWLVKAIHLTAVNEMFRFLEIDDARIGLSSSTREKRQIKAPIIYPRDYTGRTDKVRVVSFMMSPEDLMNSAYVLRKDNWNKSIFLYQRLINCEKIKKVRKFVEEKGEAFYNNIIVVLPDDACIEDEHEKYIPLTEVKELPEKCELVIPKKRNSICIIDGQHRVYAHYESGIDTPQEQKIAVLRKKLHLLVTGLVFDRGTTVAERAKVQSEIFLDINSNASPVPQSVLLQIQRLRDPVGSESLAQLVVEKLNTGGVFEGLFQLSELEDGRIKTASIVRFALKYLVTINPTEGKKSLYDFWDGDKDALIREEEVAIDEYASYCAGVVRLYFGAIKAKFGKEWADPTSTLLSVVSINGFIISLTRQLVVNGLKDFEYYKEVFNNWDYSFYKESFLYASSQYRKFSTEILEKAFHIAKETLEVI